MAARPYLLADVACCVLNAAAQVLDQFGYLPDYRYVAPKGMDTECCGSLVVVPGDSGQAPNNNDPRCVNPRTYTFAIEVGVCVNEGLSCRETGDCCDLPERWNPCERPAPSKSAEARFLLGLRYSLERDLPAALGCCLDSAEGCDGEPLRIRCQAIKVTQQATLTDGGCHFVVTVVELTW